MLEWGWSEKEELNGEVKRGSACWVEGEKEDVNGGSEEDWLVGGNEEDLLVCGFGTSEKEDEVRRRARS